MVYLEGTITGGRASGWGTTSADSIVEQLGRVRRTPGIEALVVRINSPGGTVAASQEVHTELQKIKELDIPVVVSMGDTAASGGYLAAMAADHIIANPGTITGSIGVIMEVINYRELADKLGIDFETIISGPYKDIGSPSREMTLEERELLQNIVDEMHRDFVEIVAQGRNMDADSVFPLAQGQIYTGNQALELGLIDSLGSYTDALERAADMAELSSWEVRDFSQVSLWQALGFGLELSLKDILTQVLIEQLDTTGGMPR